MNEQQLRNLLNAPEDHPKHEANDRQELLKALNRIVVNAGQAKPGDIIEILENDKPTGRTYIVVLTPFELLRPGYTRARQHANADRLTVEISNPVPIRIVNVGVH